ncbi:MAG: hypothetical protein AAF950_15955 [Pseudomonadota bacterium]
MRSFLAIIAFSLSLAPQVSGQENDELGDLFACLEEFKNGDRLSCYDDAVETLYNSRYPPAPTEPAVVPPDISIADPEEVEPDNTTVAAATTATPEPVPQAADATQAAARQRAAIDARNADGKYASKVTKFGYRSDDKIVVWLENGQIWQQTDSLNLRRQTKNGIALAELRPGLLGSTWMELDGGKAFKAKRID